MRRCFLASSGILRESRSRVDTASPGGSLARAIWILLTVSVGLNIVLLVRGPSTEPPVKALVKDDAATSLEEDDGAATHRAPAETPRNCEEQVARLESQARALEEKARPHRSMDEQFATKSLNSKLTAKLQAELERLTAKLDGGEEAWTVECRDSICRILFMSSERGGWRLQNSLQNDTELRRQFNARQFGIIEPTTEMPSKRILFQSTAFLEERAESEIDVRKVGLALDGKLKALKFDDCLLNAPDAGPSVASIRLEEGRAPAIAIAGGVAFTGAEECIRSRIAGEIQRFGPVPFTQGPLSFLLSLTGASPTRSPQ